MQVIKQTWRGDGTVHVKFVASPVNLLGYNVEHFETQVQVLVDDHLRLSGMEGLHTT